MLLPALVFHSLSTSDIVGRVALQLAGGVVGFIGAMTLLAYTLGVYVASRGGGADGLGAARRVFDIPLVYAVAAALGARWLGVVPPAGSTAMETLKLVGDAAIPVMLLLLGVELANTDPGVALRRVGPVNVTKLGIAPLVGLGVALAVGLEGTVGRTFVLECATPAAVTPLILVLEFGGGATTDGISAAEYVSTAVLTTTLLSLVTLTVLIAVLESGVLL